MKRMNLAIDKLRALGFNQYESKAYLTLLEHGPLSASEVSSKSKIPRPRVYDVLDGLSKRGIVIVHPGRPGRYQSVRIKTLVETVKKEERKKLESKLKGLSKLQKELENMPSKDATSGKETVWVLKGENALLRKAEDIIKSSQEDVILGGSLAKHLKKHAGILKKASDQGVSIRVATPKQEKKMLSQFQFADHKPVESADVLVSDDHVLFLLNKDRYSGLWVKNRAFADSMRKML